MSDRESLKAVLDQIHRLEDSIVERRAVLESIRNRIGADVVKAAEEELATPEPDGEWATTLAFVETGRNGFRWGARITKIARGMVEVALPVTREGGAGDGAGGGVHGGFLAALIDMTGVSAAFTSLKRGQFPRGTAHLEVTYLRPAIGNHVLARAHVVRAGKALTVVRVDIEDEKGKAVATGKILYAVGGTIEPPPAAVPERLEGSQYTAFGPVPRL